MLEHIKVCRPDIKTQDLETIDLPVIQWKEVRISKRHKQIQNGPDSSLRVKTAAKHDAIKQSTKALAKANADRQRQKQSDLFFVHKPIAGNSKGSIKSTQANRNYTTDTASVEIDWIAEDNGQ